MKLRLCLLCAGGFLLPAIVCAAPWSKIDLDTAEGYVQASRKIYCSLQDNKVTVFSAQGHMWSRMPGEKDRRLFALEWMKISHCETLTDPEKGTGYRMASREITLFKDPETGEVLRSWTNPWTGEELEVIHLANDPANRPPNFGRQPDGSPKSLDLVMYGDTFFHHLEVPFFYRSPLGGVYQEEVGGAHHSTIILNLSGNIHDLRDVRQDTAQTHMAWIEIRPWLPWMNMGDRPGMMYFNMVGGRLPGWQALSATMKQELRRNYPEYRKPPPLDDQRRNETILTYVKKILDQRRARDARKARGQR